MELIPIVALIGLFATSNNDGARNNRNNKNNRKSEMNSSNKNNVERFVNMGKKVNELPNTNIPPSNYPVMNKKELVDTVQHYSSPNNATDKYFDQNYYKKGNQSGKNTGNNIQKVYSLTGDYISSTDFEHNNMLPFNGGKVRGQVYNVNNAETQLDNMAGMGSQTIEKIEQAPLFKPEQNMQWANGTPNMSEFYQSRVNPGMKSSDVKPFESERVGPGLNQGYDTNGSGGFNSGMEARDEWLPKTVDELRVATNPKIEYKLDNLEGPANSHIKQIGKIGKVEKYKPDGFFIQTQDRWLTTTGSEKAQALRPLQELSDTSRTTTTKSYTGIAGADNNGTYAPENFEDSRIEQLPAPPVSHSSAQGHGTHEDKDIAQNSHTNYAGNRGMNKQPDTVRSGFSAAIGAVIAPIMDILNPTRKEEYSHNTRIYGNHATTAVKESYVMNPNDKTPTTIKETTLHTPNLFVNNQGTGTGYMVNEQQPIDNQRDTTNYSGIGGVGGAASAWGEMDYTAGYAQINNESKEKSIVSRTNQGNTQIYNQQMNVSIAKNECDRNNNRQWVPSNMPSQSMAKETYGAIRKPQTYNQNIGSERMTPDLLTAFKENPYTHSLTNTA